jgi:hypothetical protein
MTAWIARVLAALAIATIGLRAAPVRAQDDAAEVFAEGRRAFDAERYEEALEAFERSQRLMASPNSRLMAARSLRALGRLVEAREELWGAEGDASLRVAAEPRYRDTLRAAQQEGSELDALIARVRLRVDGAGPETSYAIQVGERPVDPARSGEVLWVMPGEVLVVVEAADGRSARALLRAQAGEVHSLAIALPPLEPETPAEPEAVASPAPLPVQPEPIAAAAVSPFAPIGWIALGLGAASLGAFGVFYAVADDHYAQLATRCASMPCTAADVGDGPTFELLSNVFFVSSLVLLPMAAASLVAAQLDVGSVSFALGPGALSARVLF